MVGVQTVDRGVAAFFQAESVLRGGLRQEAGHPRELDDGEQPAGLEHVVGVV
ncbi:hypothetical protein ACFYXD_09220 [Streptomyces platensis]|uniref:hypothetical protein n=1 Tax=Streptomyces platensis TaxID=58346 RepID=UPI0036C60618